MLMTNVVRFPLTLMITIVMKTMMLQMRMLSMMRMMVKIMVIMRTMSMMRMRTNDKCYQESHVGSPVTQRVPPIPITLVVVDTQLT